MTVKILFPTGVAELKPTNVAVSSARTCYFAGGIVEPMKSEGWKSKEMLLSSIFEAGHHTTLQHTHFTLLINGASRHFIWRLLHSHPYYNSEQVSQRYAKMSPDAFVYPADADVQSWQEFYSFCFERYEMMIELLEPIMKTYLPKFKQKESLKKAQEFARYMLPQGMSAYMYHTINLATALRYIGAVKALPECALEAADFAKQLAEQLLAIDPELAPMIEYAKSEKCDFPEFDLEAVKSLYDITSENVKVFDIVNGFGFDAKQNYASVLRFSQMFEDGGILGGFSSYVKLSLSADAQNQRHRRSFAVRPALEKIYKQDYYTPPFMREHKVVLEFYKETIEKMYQFFEKKVGALGFGEAVYALPNSHNIEIVERNDFASFHHKAQMRLCYNAQQEIFDIVYEQALQLRAKNVTNCNSFLPPCGVREQMKIHPICPEGSRFCGYKVWKKEFDKLNIREI
jgi:flavin-dependent thymidylate synthase